MDFLCGDFCCFANWKTYHKIQHRSRVSSELAALRCLKSLAVGNHKTSRKSSKIEWKSIEACVLRLQMISFATDRISRFKSQLQFRLRNAIDSIRRLLNSMNNSCLDLVFGRGKLKLHTDGHKSLVFTALFVVQCCRINRTRDVRTRQISLA